MVSSPDSSDGKGNEESSKQKHSSTSSWSNWNIGGSGSIGSILLQLQRKEQETRHNKNSSESDTVNEVIHLDREQQLSKGASSTHSHTSSSTPSSQQPDVDNETSMLSAMDTSMARELDDAVSIRLSSSPGQHVETLELSSLHKILRQQPISQSRGKPQVDDAYDNSKHSVSVQWSNCNEDTLNQEMKQLAISVALAVDDVAGYKTYCQQIRGGIAPLVKCIQEGAAVIQQQLDQEELPRYTYKLPSSSTRLPPGVLEEEVFVMASKSCQALGHLCSISPELAAVVTDDLLHINKSMANQTSLMEDLVILLSYTQRANVNVTTPLNRRIRIRFPWSQRNEKSSKTKWNMGKIRRKARRHCRHNIIQLLWHMVRASDNAVNAIRCTEGLQEAVLRCSSFARVEQTRRWFRYAWELIKSFGQRVAMGRKKSLALRKQQQRHQPFVEATSIKSNSPTGHMRRMANQILAAIGYNHWVRKIPGQKGLRILCLDGGGSRGIASVVVLNHIVEALGGVEVADCFDMVVGTSTGAIIAFLVGLKRETSKQTEKRYDSMIPSIFTKSALSTPLLLLTTATYDDSPFMKVLNEVVGDDIMLDSRSDPSAPYVAAVSTKLSSTPTNVALFRNYNYNGGELPDALAIAPEKARQSLGLTSAKDEKGKSSNRRPTEQSGGETIPSEHQYEASRHPGSFRVLQRNAVRASTAAPTFFKPIFMGGELYSDGGIVASNPSAIAIHEARTLFPNVPIEMVVSIGTGAFVEHKSVPRIGWDGIIGQIVNSACDGEQIHHILQDILGSNGAQVRRSQSLSNSYCYMRFNPILGYQDDFPIDITDPIKLERLKQVTRDYMASPEQQQKLQHLAKVLRGHRGHRKWFGTREK